MEDRVIRVAKLLREGHSLLLVIQEAERKHRESDDVGQVLNLDTERRDLPALTAIPNDFFPPEFHIREPSDHPNLCSLKKNRRKGKSHKRNARRK